MYNGHADVTALLDSAGTTVGTYYYDAFGNIVSQTGSFNNNITYAGYQYDSETGLYYLNSRMYDPVTARFLQQDDPSYVNPNDPLSLNLYTYCTNNPIMYEDPDGHKANMISDGNESGKSDNSVQNNADQMATDKAVEAEMAKMKALEKAAAAKAAADKKAAAIKTGKTKASNDVGSKKNEGASKANGTLENIKNYIDYQKQAYNAGLAAFGVVTVSVKSMEEDLRSFTVANKSYIFDEVGGFINPKAIRFTQDSIGKNFGETTEHAGEAVENLIKGLKKGSIKAKELPAIRIFEKDGKVWSLDNRRLYAAQQAGVDIKYVWVKAKDVATEIKDKFNPINDGLSIKVRKGK
jgi:RHS repeat-associated protein